MIHSNNRKEWLLPISREPILLLENVFYFLELLDQGEIVSITHISTLIQRMITLQNVGQSLDLRRHRTVHTAITEALL